MPVKRQSQGFESSSLTLETTTALLRVFWKVNRTHVLGPWVCKACTCCELKVQRHSTASLCVCSDGLYSSEFLFTSDCIKTVFILKILL